MGKYLPCPCHRDCPDRWVDTTTPKSCRSSCEKYHLWQESEKVRKADIQAIREQESALSDHFAVVKKELHKYDYHKKRGSRKRR